MTLTVNSITPGETGKPSRLMTTAGAVTVWPDRLPRGPNGAEMPPTGTELDAELTTRARGRFTDTYMESWCYRYQGNPGDESDAHLKATAFTLAFNDVEPLSEITNRAQDYLNAMRRLQ